MHFFIFFLSDLFLFIFFFSKFFSDIIDQTYFHHGHLLISKSLVGSSVCECFITDAL